MLIKLKLQTVQDEFASAYIKHRRITIDDLKLKTLRGKFEDDYDVDVNNLIGSGA